MRLDLHALASRLPPRPLTRFAPSPTGFLHLGHVVNAIHVWGVARALGGRVLLRIEDHDRMRSRPEYERAAIEDLGWLGFEADAGPLRQTDAPDACETALAQLARTHEVYACGCSRREIAAGVPTAPGIETPYPGRCRDRGLPMAKSHAVRVRMEAGIERFHDARLGPQEQEPSSQCGDLLLRDRHGQWTYQFAVTVDDIRQRIDLVIRGADLLSSTGRQIRLARMLGRGQPPVFLHHDLVLKPDGEKVSKSSGDVGVRDLRAAGVSAAEVIGRAAAAVHLIDAPRAVPASDVVHLFS